MTYVDMLRGWLTRQDPKEFLSFTRTPAGTRAGTEFLERLKERCEHGDKEITLTALAAQLKALRRWGANQPADLSQAHHPVLVANGDSDRMVPSQNTRDLARRLPNSELLSRFRTRSGVPVSCRLRAQGTCVPLEMINVSPGMRGGVCLNM